DHLRALLPARRRGTPSRRRAFAPPLPRVSRLRRRGGSPRAEAGAAPPRPRRRRARARRRRAFARRVRSRSPGRARPRLAPAVVAAVARAASAPLRRLAGLPRRPPRLPNRRSDRFQPGAFLRALAHRRRPRARRPRRAL